MTAILPSPVGNQRPALVAQLGRENANLRVMVDALLDQLIGIAEAQAGNYAEHPYSPEELAALRERARDHYRRLALNAVAKTKDGHQ